MRVRTRRCPSKSTEFDMLFEFGTQEMDQNMKATLFRYMQHEKVQNGASSIIDTVSIYRRLILQMIKPTPIYTTYLTISSVEMFVSPEITRAHSSEFQQPKKKTSSHQAYRHNP
jgi:hypothetical protein